MALVLTIPLQFVGPSASADWLLAASMGTALCGMVPTLHTRMTLLNRLPLSLNPDYLSILSIGMSSYLTATLINDPLYSSVLKICTAAAILGVAPCYRHALALPPFSPKEKISASESPAAAEPDPQIPSRTFSRLVLHPVAFGNSTLGKLAACAASVFFHLFSLGLIRYFCKDETFESTVPASSPDGLSPKAN